MSSSLPVPHQEGVSFLKVASGSEQKLHRGFFFSDWPMIGPEPTFSPLSVAREILSVHSLGSRPCAGWSGDMMTGSLLPCGDKSEDEASAGRRDKGWRHLNPGGFTEPPNPPGATYLQDPLLCEIIKCPEYLPCAAEKILMVIASLWDRLSYFHFTDGEAEAPGD